MILGYLERPYLADPYLSGFNTGAQYGTQVRMVIARQQVAPAQVLMQVVDDLAGALTQIHMVVDDTRPVQLQTNLIVEQLAQARTQVAMLVNAQTPVGTQTTLTLAGITRNVATQVSMLVESVAKVHAQVNMLTGTTAPTGVQAAMQTIGARITGMQQKISPLLQTLCGNTYLTDPYLTTSYLAYGMCAHQGVQVAMNAFVETEVGAQANMIILKDMVPHIQVNMVVFDDAPVGAQADMRVVDREKPTSAQVALQIVDRLKPARAQVLMRIVDRENPLGMQVLMVQSVQVLGQVTMVIYNTTQLRMMKQFASRGTPALGGNNWTCSPPAATGDFSPNNLNTDVIEQCWRSRDGDTALVSLVCDTGLPQGAFVDTAALLGHNLTRSAVVTLQGSNVADFSTVGFSTILNSEELNTYYIAPDLPTTGFRWWRFVLEDPTNPAGFLSIGTLIFGAAEIFTVLENFTNPVTMGHKHFKDVVETEGFTNVSNDRALRKYLRLSFEKLLANNGNYGKLRNTFLFARTGLKVLYIPTPSYPSRFAIFGKLERMPEESHTSHSATEEYIDLSLDIDESL
jgi:hypothetical protein